MIAAIRELRLELCFAAVICGAVLIGAVVFGAAICCVENRLLLPMLVLR